MKKVIAAAAFLLTAGLPPLQSQYAPAAFSGQASWYSRHDATDPWVHTRTASGAAFDESALTCALRSRDFGKFYRVTNVANGKSVVVKHTDFGPARSWTDPRTGKRVDLSRRVIDLSKAAYLKIADLKTGVAQVRVEGVQ